MLVAKVLNSAATLNDFKEIYHVEFMYGNGFPIVLRLIDPQLGDRYVPPSTAVITLTFKNLDSTTFTKVATFVDPNDRSLVTTTLLTTDTCQMYGGNIPFTVDVLGDGTQILYGNAFNALRRIAVNWDVLGG